MSKFRFNAKWGKITTISKKFDYSVTLTLTHVLKEMSKDHNRVLLIFLKHGLISGVFKK